MSIGFKKFKTERDKIFYCSKEVYRPEGSSEIWLKDYKTEIPFIFKCVNCEVSKIDLSKLELSGGERYRISLEIDNTLISDGLFPWIIQCDNCRKIYHIENGYKEPNRGRDVITLTGIFEINELTQVEKVKTIELSKWEEGDHRIVMQYRKILNEVSIQVGDQRIDFIFESLLGFNDRNLPCNLDIFVRYENKEEKTSLIPKFFLEELQKGIEEAIREEENNKYKMIGSIGLKFSKIKYESKNRHGIKREAEKRSYLSEKERDEINYGFMIFFKKILESYRMKNKIENLLTDEVKIKDLIER